MRDLKLYWQEIRSLERSLPEFVWLTSVEDAEGDGAGGRVVEVPAAQAASLLYSKSHRLATEEEIGKHRAEEEAAKRRVRQEGLRGRGIAIVTVPEGKKAGGAGLQAGLPAPPARTLRGGGRGRRPGGASGR